MPHSRDDDRPRRERRSYERRENSDRHRDRRDHSDRSERRERSNVERSERHRDRHKSHKSRSRSRERDSPESSKVGAMNPQLLERPKITERDLEGKSKEEQEMMKLMGFGGFDSTKGKPVPGNDISAVNILQKRKYRQYMNRKGGFNRPLDFVD